ncbi:hypothetical protein [Heyndrickxia camelliae]|uniref:Uncharacterized protein n=1 Tax=Heyndrickxia camelliae TaxID=1707093 RepID=A0A2N3LFX2_9BACI|nr:hypothetical protein [Heyndrickxia camelliae]PKR83518.1 hypothetical protein CWO92_18300 [Heyndrickxia camelliae]
MTYSKPSLLDFVNNSGKYLALMNDRGNEVTRYLTFFIVSDKNKATEEIESIINDLGQCSKTIYNYDRVDYFIEGLGWFYLVDYTNGVIEC